MFKAVSISLKQLAHVLPCQNFKRHLSAVSPAGRDLSAVSPVRRDLLLLVSFLFLSAQLYAQSSIPTSTVTVPTPQVTTVPRPEVPTPQAVQASMPIPEAPVLPVKSYVLMEHETGQILAEQNANERVEPASITKVMAAYVVFHELRAGRAKLTDLVEISERAWRMEGSRMFAKVGDKIPLEQLMLGMIVQSGNDSTVAIAEHLAGTEDAFVAMMNNYAKKLGLTGTNFTNSPGLSSPEHYTTARDVAQLARAVVNEFPDYYKWYSVREFTWNNVKQYNRNQLLARDQSVDGMKTGHTENAGYCLVASAKRQDLRLFSVVMGSDSEGNRTQQSQAVLNYGFRFFESHQLYAAGQVLKEPEIYKGDSDTVKLGVANALRIVIPRGHYEKLSASMELPSLLSAPIAKGQALGMVRVKLQDKLVAERSLVAIDAVAEGGFFSRMADGIALWWRSE
jgi:serine-type D-Ala-D-Ala carboxypeptidase (penicillin-binding protein 5/6)